MLNRKYEKIGIGIEREKKIFSGLINQFVCLVMNGRCVSFVKLSLAKP